MGEIPGKPVLAMVRYEETTLRLASSGGVPERGLTGVYG